MEVVSVLSLIAAKVFRGGTAKGYDEQKFLFMAGGLL
jgi:hypothetical protein